MLSLKLTKEERDNARKVRKDMDTVVQGVRQEAEAARLKQREVDAVWDEDD